MLNAEQQAVVDSNSNRIAVMAGAGTGKTHTMLSRINRIIAEGASPDSILVLTFTKAAADEMEQRYNSSNQTTDSPKFCTFHAFCYQLIMSDESVRTAIGYLHTPDIASPEYMNNVINEVKSICKIKLSTSRLNKPLSEQRKSDLAEYRIFWKQFRRELKIRNIITFDMLSEAVSKLFTDNDTTIHPYLEQYKYIFVDEFQDTDSTQWEFVSSFKDSNIFVCGDIMQSIYGFRGCDSSIMKSLINDPAWTVLKLSVNYRSSPEICNFANKISASAAHKCSVELQSQQPSGKISKSTTDNVEEAVKKCITKGGTTALIARTNAEVAYLRNIFGNQELKYNYKVVKCIIDSIFNNDAQQFNNMLVSMLPDSDYVRYLKAHFRDVSQFDIETFSKQYDIPAILDACELYSKINCIVNSSRPAVSKYCDICCAIGSSPSIDVEICSEKEIVQAVYSSLNSTLNKNIYIGTIHSVKGLEYDNVIVFGVAGQSFPICSEESKNLFYVAVTRAKSLLLLLYDNK